MTKPPRVLIAKPGLDGHDRGAKTVVHALRDAGIEVVYTGLHKTIDEIIEIAGRERVDVIGLSIMSGAHISLCQELVAKVAASPLAGTPLMAGGVIPEPDVPRLREIGIDGVFPVASPYEEIVAFVKDKTHGG